VKLDLIEAAIKLIQVTHWVILSIFIVKIAFLKTEIVPLNIKSEYYTIILYSSSLSMKS